MKGTVMWFDDERGIGFIRAENGQEFFVHHASIEMEGYKTLSQGDTVSFSPEESHRGPEATGVIKVD